MFVVGRELAGALRSALLFASADITRASQNCVHLEAVGSALRVVATDGHTMWLCEVPARDGVDEPPPAHQTPWNLYVDDASAIASRVKDVKEVEVYLAKRIVKSPGVTVAYEQRSPEFSRYEYVVPSVAQCRGGKVIPEFAAAYVARACEALKIYGKAFAPEVEKGLKKYEKERALIERDAWRDPPIAWRVGGECDPAIFFSSKFPRAVALVMPRRGDGTNNVSVEAFLDSVTRGKATAA